MFLPRSRGKRLVVFLLCYASAACYSTATLHSARPIEPGTFRGAVALGGYVGDDDGNVDVYPTIEGQVRYGIDERLDAGLHVTDFGILGLDLNYALLLTDDQALSIDPGVEFSFGTYVWLPLLWDFYHTEDLTLTASLRGGRYWLDVGDSDEDGLLDGLEADAWLYGGGLAARIRLNDAMALAPEVRVMWAEPEGNAPGDALVSVSIGLIF